MYGQVHIRLRSRVVFELIIIYTLIHIYIYIYVPMYKQHIYINLYTLATFTYSYTVTIYIIALTIGLIHTRIQQKRDWYKRIQKESLISLTTTFD
jgi:hypothetical protein